MIVQNSKKLMKTNQLSKTCHSECSEESPTSPRHSEAAAEESPTNVGIKRAGMRQRSFACWLRMTKEKHGMTLVEETSFSTGQAKKNVGNNKKYDKNILGLYPNK
jgi:hypothetical protein